MASHAHRLPGSGNGMVVTDMLVAMDSGISNNAESLHVFVRRATMFLIVVPFHGLPLRA
jgi:hypothetical protein